MVNRTVKKLKAELEDLRKDLTRSDMKQSDIREELATERAKVEVLDESNRKFRSELFDNSRKMEDQVQWMRNLIEALTIDPKVIYAKTDRDIRQGKLQVVIRRQEAEDRKVRQRFPADEVEVGMNKCMHGQYPGVCRETPCIYKF